MEKKSMGFGIISIVLVLLVGMLGSYILVDKFLSNDNDVSQEENDVYEESHNDVNCEPIIKTINYEDMGKNLFIEYIKEKEAVNYQINSVDLVIGCSNEFVLSINYDVEVSGNPHSSNFGAGNGSIEGQWIRDKMQFVTFELENENYKITSMVTGYPNNFNSCSNGKIVVANAD